MVFPSTRQTFPTQLPETVADNDFINDITDLLVALQDKIGLSSASPVSSSHEGRLRSLEGGGLHRVFFLPVVPTGTPILGDLWINTASEPWIQYYFDGVDWSVMGSITPTDQQVPVYNSGTDRIIWTTILTNPMNTAGEMIVGGVDGALQALPAGLDNTVLVIDAVTHAPHWAATPSTFEQLHVNQYFDFEELSVAPSLSSTGELRVYADFSNRLFYSANGAAYQPIGAGTDLGSMFTTRGAMAYASNPGVVSILPVGAESSALVVVGGIPHWQLNAFIAGPSAAVQGSILQFDGTNWIYLPPGTAGQFLKTFGPSTMPAWTDLPSSPPGSGIASPVGSTTGDILVHNGTDWIRLAAGATGRFLQTQGTSGAPVWAVLPPSLSNPMSAPGDMIIGTIGGAPLRLAGGTGNNDRVLTISGGMPTWLDNPASLGRVMFMTG
jgi:hypothetical protein